MKPIAFFKPDSIHVQLKKRGRKKYFERVKYITEIMDKEDQNKKLESN